MSLWVKSKNKIMNVKKSSYQYFSNFHRNSGILNPPFLAQYYYDFYAFSMNYTVQNHSALLENILYKSM